MINTPLNKRCFSALWPDDIQYPQFNVGQGETKVFIDDIIVTKKCFCENVINETQLSCPERSFQPNCIDPNHTYSWESSDGGMETGPLFDHTFQNGSHTITLTVTDECNNSKTLTKNITVACNLACNHCPTNALFFIDPMKSKLSEYNITSIPSSSCIVIDGQLIIDVNDIILNNCTVYMEAGSEIYIQSGNTLTSYHSIFSGCDYMWKSITVPTGAKFVAEDLTTIKDAWRGIDAIGSPTLNLSNSWFINNYVGIYVQEGTIITDYPIQYNLFKTEGAFKMSNDPLRPTPTIGYAGVQTLGGNIVLGSDGDGGLPNFFENLNNGVVSIGGRISIFNAQINNMIEDFSRTTGGHLDNGCGVHCMNCYLDANRNSILETATGISANGSGARQTICLDNSMNSVIRGIYISNVINIVRVNNNKITYKAAGISVFNPTKITNFELIKNDPLTQLDVSHSAHGILIQNLKQIAPDKLSQVQLNKIYHYGNGIGIWLTECESVGLQDNEVHFSSNVAPISGILLTNTQNSNLYNNIVTGVGINSTSESSYKAFLIAGSANCIFCQNNASNINFGFVFQGICTSDDKFRFNIMNNHKQGLRLDVAVLPFYGASVLGTQEFNANEWNGTYIQYAAANANSDQRTILRSQFKINICDQPLWPESIYPDQGPCEPLDQNASNEWFYRLNGSGSSVCNPPFGLNPNSDNDDLSESEPELLSTNDVNTALGLFGEEYSPMNFEMPLDLYRKLNENQELLELNNSIDSFYLANHNTNIYKFYKIDSALRLVFRLDTNERQILKSHVFVSDSLKNLIRINDSLLATVTTYQDSMNLANQKKDMFGDLYEIYNGVDSILIEIEETRQAMIPIIESWNEAIVPDGLVETNRKTTNEVLLQTVYREIKHLTQSQMNLISPIAMQCMLIGGRGVLIARTLYLLNEEFHFDDDILCQPIQPIVKSNEILNKQSKFSLQPNPNKGSFSLFRQSEIQDNDLSLEIIDMDGKNLYQQMIKFENRQFVEINSNLKTGLYFVKIYNKKDQLFICKIFIE